MVICYVLGCKSRSERKYENITFHSFPKDSTTRNLWIQSTGRGNCWIPNKYAKICSIHFEKKCFKKRSQNNILEKFSVPTLHICTDQSLQRCDDSLKCSKSENPVTTGDEMDTEPSQICDAMEMPTTSCAAMDIDTHVIESVTPRKRKLLKKLDRQMLLAQTRKRKLAIFRAKNRRLLKKNAELSAIIEEMQEKRLINQDTADILSEVHPKSDFLKSSKSKFSPEVRKFALTLHFISPRAYNFVRNSFNTCLPHTRTLARWYQSVEGDPGFTTESFSALKLLVKNSGKKYILCALCFDEMAIRRLVEWDGKQFVGFVNCGNQLISDSLPVAKEALVFMLTCLNGSWKLPVGYFLIDGITAEQKASLVKTCIDLITECGVEVASITFDGCPINFSMAKLLGCQITNDEINPIFSYKDKKIAIIPDPSHMLKLVRNTLGDKEYLSNEKGDIVSWRFFKMLHEIQEEEGFHLANKLRSAHVNFKKQIMKVKLASQLFSESVADAMEFCWKNIGLQQFKNCEETVNFIRKFNALFDILFDA